VRSYTLTLNGSPLCPAAEGEGAAGLWQTAKEERSKHEVTRIFIGHRDRNELRKNCKEIGLYEEIDKALPTPHGGS
jgi:hypothetical protein